MLLIIRYKPILLLLLLFFLGACGVSNKPTIKKMSLNANQSPLAVKVFQDDNLGVSEVFTKDKEEINLLESINSRLPVFILASTINSSSSIYGQSLCNSLNNDFANDKYVCIVQNQPNLDEWVNYLKKDDLSVNPNVPFVADFLVTRVDYLIEKQQSNSGPLKDYPILDAVMFLNGNYLYLWGDSSYSAVELSHFVSNFNNKHKGLPVKIAISNKLAKSLLTKIILANKWPTDFEFVNLEENLNSHSSKDNYVLIADAGPYVSNNIEKYIDTYHKNFLPLSLSNDIIANTQKANPEVSQEDLGRYYSSLYLTNIVKVISQIEHVEHKSASSSKNSNSNSNDSVVNNQEETDNCSLPFITVVKYGVDYDKYVFGRSKFDFNIKSIEDILKEDKVINANNIKVMGIGIKNILVAPRVTDPLKVYSLLSAFLSKYDLIKVNYSTPDMCNSNIQSLLLGNLYLNNLIYHYGVINFITYATNNKALLWGKEAEIVNVISKYLDEKNSPPFYGPNMPNSEQINIIRQVSKRRVITNKQEKTLESLQYLIDEIKSELETDTSKDSNFQHSTPVPDNKVVKKNNEEKNRAQETLLPLSIPDSDLGRLGNMDLSPSNKMSSSSNTEPNSNNSEPMKEEDLINVLNDLHDLLDNS